MAYVLIILLNLKMRKIANFTQTYSASQWSPGTDGQSREFLIDALRLNSGKIDAINSLDLQTFNFHNLSEEESKRLATKVKSVIPNCEFYVYQNMTLGSTILKHLNLLLKRGITDFMWIQDDEFFTYNNIQDFYDVLNFYKSNPEIKHINLLHAIQNGAQVDRYTKHYGVKDADKININENIILYKTNTEHLKDANNYAMDFTAFVCDITYFLKYMFNESFVNFFDAYKLEGAVNEYSIKNNVQRYITNVNFFESFNIVGLPPSLGKSNEALKRLRTICRES